MQNKVQALAGFRLPLIARLISAAAGILIAGIGMSNFLSGGPMSEVFIPVIAGAVIVYLSGYDRKIYMDAEGIWRETFFWRPRWIESVMWEDITDVRILLNRGRNIYVIAHGYTPIWPCTFKPSQKDEVLSLLGNYLKNEDIHVEG